MTARPRTCGARSAGRRNISEACWNPQYSLRYSDGIPLALHFNGEGRRENLCQNGLRRRQSMTIVSGRLLLLLVLVIVVVGCATNSSSRDPLMIAEQGFF